MKASLSPRVRGSIGTKTAPVIEAAIIASTNSGWLRIISAKRSPGFTPRATSAGGDAVGVAVQVRERAHLVGRRAAVEARDART